MPTCIRCARAPAAGLAVYLWTGLKETGQEQRRPWCESCFTITAQSMPPEANFKRLPLPVEAAPAVIPMQTPTVPKQTTPQPIQTPATIAPATVTEAGGTRIPEFKRPSVFPTYPKTATATKTKSTKKSKPEAVQVEMF